MKDNGKNETTTSIAIEVKTQNFNDKGEVISAMVAGSKLTKADAGRLAFVDEDSLTFKSSGCGCPKIEVDHNSTSNDIKLEENATKNSTLEVDVKAQIKVAGKLELIDAIASGAKLTKADAGRLLDRKSEEWFNLQAEGANGTECGKTEMRSHSKLTKADSGKTA
ncbi:MAG: hypothetical protein V4580_02095 [Bacteroidota bacterium]